MKEGEKKKQEYEKEESAEGDKKRKYVSLKWSLYLYCSETHYCSDKNWDLFPSTSVWKRYIT
jgi:hypothetical protein